MTKHGFSRFNGVSDISFIDVPGPDPVPVVKSPEDVIMDSIFAIDENGFPCSSFAKLLSPKTSDDVRKYIEDTIMVCKSENHVISDDQIVKQFGELDSDFLAAASRNRFESIQDYEKRLGDYLDASKQEAEQQKRISRYKKWLDDNFKYSKDDSE